MPLRTSLLWFDLSMTTLGLLGNGVTMAVLCQATLRSSTSVLLLSMVVYDSLYLVANLIMPIDGIPYFNLNIDNDTIFTAEYVFVCCSVYTVVLITLERYVAVSSPLRARRVCTIKNAGISVVAIFTLSVIFCVPREIKIFTDTRENTTIIVNCYELSKNFSKRLYCEITASIVILLIPFPLILIFNLLIVHVLLIRRKVVRRLSNDVNDVGNALTRAAVGITMCYIICCVFPGIYYIGIGFRRPSKDVEKILSDFANSLLIVNCSTNFILYCLLGKTFRQVLLTKVRELFDCCVVKSYNSGPSFSESSVFETVHLKGILTPKPSPV